MGSNVCVNVPLGPREHGVITQDTANIHFKLRFLGPDRGLVRSDAAQPNISFAQKVFHRLDFVDGTTPVQVPGEEKLTLRIQLFDIRPFRLNFPQRESPAILQVLGESIGFWEHEAGVNHHHFNGIGKVLADHVKQGNTLGLERRGGENPSTSFRKFVQPRLHGSQGRVRKGFNVYGRPHVRNFGM